MKVTSLKTRTLNAIRNVAKISVLENFLVEKTQGKSTRDFYAKLIPNNYQYPFGTIRRCERDGIKYELDISDYMQYCIYYGIEIEPRDKLYGLIENGTTVVDIGTNIGETLLNFAKLNDKGTNLGFEPVPFLYKKAQKHIEINEFNNIVLENLALSNDFGNLNFNFSNGNNSGGIYLTEADGKDSEKTVEAMPLDYYVEKNDVGNISLIKIDVEGFEMNVLRGARRTLEKHQPTLFVEVDDLFLRRQNTSTKELLDFLWTLNYEIFYVENQTPVLKEHSFDNKHFDIIAKHSTKK